MKYIFLLLTLTLGQVSVFAQQPDWFVKLMKLQEFPATEKDVNTFFDSPKVIYSTPESQLRSRSSWTKIIKYQLIQGKLTVHYSTGKCSEKNTKDWDLNDGTIMSYYFEVENLFPISLLKIKLDDFKLSKADDTQHIFYKNAKIGVTYVLIDEKLQYIDYTIPNLESYECEKKIKK